MNKQEKDKAREIFNIITANGMREMTETRYLQAIQEFAEWIARNQTVRKDENIKKPMPLELKLEQTIIQGMILDSNAKPPKIHIVCDKIGSQKKPDLNQYDGFEEW